MERLDSKNYRFVGMRQELGFTQESLGEQVELSQSMIAHIEAGTKEPRKKYKMRLAKLFGVSVEWLFYEQVEDEGNVQKHLQSYK